MKSLLIAVVFLTAAFSFTASAQKQPDPNQFKSKLGIKGGYNIAKIAGVKNTNFDPGNKNGFMVAAFMGLGGGTGRGYRTEIVFSRQGFSYDSMNNKIKVKQDYIYLPQLMTFNIGKFFSLQVGGQMGFLLNAKKGNDSSGSTQTDIMDYYNKIDYGVAGGFEIYPFKGIILGSRINYSLGPMYKRNESLPPGFPFPFNPNEVKGKSAVVNIFAGYKF